MKMDMIVRRATHVYTDSGKEETASVMDVYDMRIWRNAGHGTNQIM